MDYEADPMIVDSVDEAGSAPGGLPAQGTPGGLPAQGAPGGLPAQGSAGEASQCAPGGLPAQGSASETSAMSDVEVIPASQPPTDTDTDPDGIMDVISVTSSWSVPPTYEFGRQ